MGLADLDAREGWQVESFAARIHYRGDGDRYSIEYYAPSDCVLYWRVEDDEPVAVPVDRNSVPEPLRARIREELQEAGIDPAVEFRSV